MRRVCKCHGMSGSCATQTCWLQLEDFAIIGNALKKEYRRATRLRDTNALEAASNSVMQLPREEGEENAIPTVDSRRLVYLDPSPNFCFANKTAGECFFTGVLSEVANESQTKRVGNMFYNSHVHM